MLGCPEMLGLLWKTPRVGECVLVLGMLETLALPLLMAEQSGEVNAEPIPISASLVSIRRPCCLIRGVMRVALSWPIVATLRRWADLVGDM